MINTKTKHDWPIQTLSSNEPGLGVPDDFRLRCQRRSARSFPWVAYQKMRQFVASWVTSSPEWMVTHTPTASLICSLRMWAAVQSRFWPMPRIWLHLKYQQLLWWLNGVTSKDDGILPTQMTWMVWGATPMDKSWVTGYQRTCAIDDYGLWSQARLRENPHPLTIPVVMIVAIFPGLVVAITTSYS